MNFSFNLNKGDDFYKESKIYSFKYEVLFFVIITPFCKLELIFSINNILPVEDQFYNKNIELLYLSNYINGKGQNYAIKALSKAIKVNNNIKLTFVGGDMGLLKNKIYKNGLMELAKDLDVEQHISFNSFTDDIERLIKNYDIVLNFSESESFSMTCLEALYYGVPLIATDCGGPSELFIHLESGYLVQNKNIDEMVEGILFLSNSEIVRKKYSINSRSHIRKNFKISETINKFK